MSVTINRRMLLKPIDLTIPANTWSGIVGPNGGGKSTLMKAIAGLVDHQGKITLHWPLAQPGRIGYMPQRVELDTSLPVTVQDYLLMHCKRRPVWLRADADERIDALVRQLEVRPFLNQRIGSLSMGQHQRLMLCAALSNEPELLMLDEPMAGVDEAGREILLRALEDYNNDGGSILMVEHNWEVVRDHCASVVWIDQGLVSSGTPESILQQLSERMSPFELQVADGKVNEGSGESAGIAGEDG